MREAKYVKDIMTTGVISIHEGDAVKKAVDIMTEHNISCVVVTNKENTQPLGIITERDLIRRVLKPNKNPKKTKAGTVMTTSLVTISEEATLEEAMRVIEGMRIRRLPVVSSTGLVGLVTQTDIVKQTHTIHKFNQKLLYHQNIQSYVILALVAIVIFVLIYRFFFL